VTILAAVPVKDLSNAKQRLVPVLTPGQRRELARAMLEDVLQALQAALPGSVVVVTADAEVIELARALGAGVLPEDANRGHTEAVAFAQAAARARHVRRFLTVPGDVPCVTPAEVLAVCDAVGESEGVAFVPSLSGFGTNAALLVPPDAMPLKFGEPSFDNHLDTARQCGLSPAIVRVPGLGLDIDAAEDLALLIERGPDTASARLLRGWGVLPRPVG